MFNFNHCFKMTSIVASLTYPIVVVTFCILTFKFPLNVDFGKASDGFLQLLRREDFSTALNHLEPVTRSMGLAILNRKGLT